METKACLLVFSPKFIEETVGVGLVKPSIVDTMHTSLHTINANLIGCRAHDRAMLLVGQVDSFVCLAEVPLPKDPRRGESRRWMCLRNGRERTDEEGMNEPFVDNVAKCEDYGEVPRACVFEDCHDIKKCKSRKNDEKKRNIVGR